MTKGFSGSPGSGHHLLVLHALRLIGFAPAERIAARSGLDVAATMVVLDELNRRDEVHHRDGRISGWTLTSRGRTAHADLLSAEREEHDADAVVREADSAFVALNEHFKQLCTRWQLLPDGTVNDHRDREHDKAVLDDLHPVHRQITAITERLARTLPRFGRYARSFDDARSRLLGGEVSAFTSPMSDSYHDLWMELHQDLLCTAGRQRGPSDGD